MVIPENNPLSAKVSLDTAELDLLIEKISRLNELLKEAVSLIGLLREEIKA